ncbi:hypothetical protein EVAR_69843_1 [Eumeta japonica]|uniref:Uncharacterized protein n=1 Tax=Eumeta variegata TaxID=151549 RepID=A0A4C1SHR5_EUMVA|nr:hypothetical protein EVAR_69843_1 [Eumeta japonica]
MVKDEKYVRGLRGRLLIWLLKVPIKNKVSYLAIIIWMPQVIRCQSDNAQATSLLVLITAEEERSLSVDHGNHELDIAA